MVAICSDYDDDDDNYDDIDDVSNTMMITTTRRRFESANHKNIHGDDDDIYDNKTMKLMAMMMTRIMMGDTTS